MKHYLTLLFTALIVTSCGVNQKVKKDIDKSDKATTPVVATVPQKKQDSMKITVGTGTKVGSAGPIKDMETTPPTTKNDTIVEINPQKIKILPNTNKEVRVAIQAKMHEKWNALLKQFVTIEGNVNYEGFRKNRPKLTAYINSLNENMPEEFWSQDEKLAYWMNAYNAMTVDLILRNLPLESIKDIDKPWEQRYWKLGAKYYNLDEIEHQILRKMDDPRIHFGINCASFSCPPLLNVAFTSEKVNDQLDFLAQQFINDPKRNTIASDSAQISKIFDWFSKDFKQNGSVIDYLNTYSETKINSNARIRYMDYDWSLNK